MKIGGPQILGLDMGLKISHYKNELVTNCHKKASDLDRFIG
jgi:hypothetical protein